MHVSIDYVLDPTEVVLEMMCRENVASHSPACLNTSLTQTTDNGLRGNSSWSRNLVSCGCCSPKSSRSCINRIYRTWAGVLALGRPDYDYFLFVLIACCVLVTQPKPANSGSVQSPHIGHHHPGLPLLIGVQWHFCVVL